MQLICFRYLDTYDTINNCDDLLDCNDDLSSATTIHPSSMPPSITSSCGALV